MQRFSVPFFGLVLFAGLTLATPHAFAQSAAELQAQIDARNAQIQSIKDEIAQYQAQLDQLGKQKTTLQSTIDSLAISQKQLGAQIRLTQGQISAATLKIQDLTGKIGDKEATIAGNQAAIAKALRTMAQNENLPLIVSLISSHTLTDAWQATDQAIQFNRALANDIASLRQARTELSQNRDQVASQKADLVSLNAQLTLQKRSVDANKLAQQQLLAQTRSQESNYQRLIAQKEASEKAFEQELVNLQGQLNLIVHPDRLPKVGTGVLSWPFSLSYMQNCAARRGVFGNIFCITQYFGNTSFSTANPQIYNGHGHNAIDISAPIGTPVRAALSGVVLGTGNTDLVAGCYSFGKWVMVTHGNGLSTLYAHLSSIDVSKGQNVDTGDVVGLSGMTGYATGPHLHFGVYATEGTQIMTLGQFRSSTVTPCKNATMPVATIDAYLNPLSYL
ncbi:MAG TPA: peptidoglycan DD-metalloendopeptidase family protein [Candidatus Paceibacterota bacterium]|nr:peptidoglycan DD-metalloendopeptidase family protein [Candidatus Paceibacterota bacterium]